jgi:flagellar hook-associated protein 2
MTQMAPGSPVEYSVNGSSEVSSDTQTITLAPGLTVSLLAQDPNTPVTITVANNDSGLSSALSSLATAYNSAVTALNAQRGQDAGPLAGQSIIFDLQSMLNNLAEYGGGPAGVPTLTSLGLEVDDTGNMSFDATTFGSLNATDIQNFLGNTTTGGFLEAANNGLNSATDPTTGSLATSGTSIQDEITSENSELADDTTRVTDLQTNLMSQLSAADAAIASLQSQNTYFTELFQAEYGSSTSNGASSSGL